MFVRQNDPDPDGQLNPALGFEARLFCLLTIKEVAKVTNPPIKTSPSVNREAISPL